MELLILIRPFFQLVNQYISGFTYLFSLVFFVCFIRDCAKSRLRFDRFEIIALCYFFLSIGISLISGSTVGTLLGQFNKLFLCLFSMLVINRLASINPHGTRASLIRKVTYLSAAFVLISLLLPSSYQSLWGAKTFQMAFSSQHETAELITLLIALIGYDLKLYSRFIPARLLIATGLLFALLMTGARTITIAGSVIYVVQLLYATKGIDRRLRGLVIVFSSVIIALVVLPGLSSTALFEKSKNLEGSGSSFSNGRDQIWLYYYSVFSNMPVINQFFGAGVGMILEHSRLAIGTHNDFLSFLISFGIVGLVFYLIYMARSLLRNGLAPCGLLAFLIFIWCAFFNGFSGYTELVFSLCVFVATYSKGAIAEPERSSCVCNLDSIYRDRPVNITNRGSVF